MNDISCAIGREQLKKLPGFIQKRKEISQMYDQALCGEDWLTLPPALPEDCKSSYYFYWVQLKNQDLRDRLAKYLKEHQIYTTFRYYPLHWVKFYQMDNCSLKNVEQAAQTTLCLPMHQSLSKQDITYIVDTICSFGKENHL